MLREVGHCITTKYNSSFLEFFDSAHGNAPALVDLIIKEFPGFRDESVNNVTAGDPMTGGQQVFFYKRAQILVGDLYGALKNRQSDLKHAYFEGKQFDITLGIGIEELTMFPDYR